MYVVFMYAVAWQSLCVMGDFVTFRLQICCVGPDFFGYPERSPCVRPSGLESPLGD